MVLFQLLAYVALWRELLEFTSSVTVGSVFGLAQEPDETSVGAVFVQEASEIKKATRPRQPAASADIPAGFDMLGRVVNPSQPIDGLGAIHATHRRPIGVQGSWHHAASACLFIVQTGLHN